ncbi:hypothetical protein PGH42_15020 [Legionella pneumophila]|nr:hypothetical protein PGH42_15020 [Legionella pneumophila]
MSFRFLPIRESFNKKNNNSCILQVSNSAGRVLLTGDIEKAAEEYLVRNYGSQLASEILVVPHHGSKTSSSYRFLLEVSPLYAIASLGFDNRFKFPHSKTLQSMKTLGITFLEQTNAEWQKSNYLRQVKLTNQPVCRLNKWIG